MLIVTGLLTGALALAGADSVRATVTARIGDGTNGPMFDRVEAVEVDPDGRVYVLDGGANNIVAFDSTGRELWRLGRQGRGPGEFDAPVGLAWSPGGTLWVIDAGNQRVTIVSRAGRLLETRILPSSFALSPWPGRFDRSGRFYHYAAPDDAGYAYSIAVLDSALRRVATRSPPAPPIPEQFFDGVTERGSPMRARVPFTPRLVWRLDSRGEFVQAWTAEMAIHGPDHTKRSRPPAGQVPPPVTRADLAAAREQLSRFIRLGGRFDESRIPASQPVLATFVLDDTDRRWALLSRPSNAADAVLNVFEADGAHAATVLVRARLGIFPTPVVRRGWLVAAEQGPDGGDVIVIARVSRFAR